MPSLLSGSTLRTGGSGEFIDLAGAMPQLPATLTTLTGFTLVTNELLQTSYRSSLGFIEFTTSSMYSAFSDGTIRILATGTTFLSTSTLTGNLVVGGGIGVGGNMHIEEDIVVNGLTIGRGYEGQNNIVLRGVAEQPLNDFPNGQEAIAIGYDALTGLITANKSLAIGRFALSSGTHLRNSIAIGDSALKIIGTIHTSTVGTITGATQADPVVITVADHNITTGTQIYIDGVGGMIELNDDFYYVDRLGTDTLALYADTILSSSVDGTGFTAFTSGGTLYRVLERDGNIAYGNEAGISLIDGRENVFIGHQSGKSMTTGSFNIIIGHNKLPYLYTGTGIISIGGDNIVDGKDDQVNIGSVFYYDGDGYAAINAETTLGLGSESTSTMSGALMVLGGAGIAGNVYLGGKLQVLGTETSTVTNNLSVGGALTVVDGATIKGYLTVNGTEDVTLTPSGADVLLTPTAGGNVEIQPNGYALINPNSLGDMDNVRIGNSTPADATFVNTEVVSTASSTSTTTGALLVTGGVGIQGDVYARTGHPAENYLLYTPVATVSTSTPTGARIGDYWINPAGPYVLLYVLDGVNKIWVQIS